MSVVFPSTITNKFPFIIRVRVRDTGHYWRRYKSFKTQVSLSKAGDYGWNVHDLQSQPCKNILAFKYVQVVCRWRVVRFHKYIVCWRFAPTPSCDWKTSVWYVQQQTIFSKLGSMMSVNIRKEAVICNELTINEPRTNPEFCSLLNEVHCGSVLKQSIGTLRGRVVNFPVVDRFS